MKRRQWVPLTAATFLLVPLGFHALEGCYSVVPNDGLVDAGPLMMADVSGETGAGFVGAGDAACSSAPGVLPDPNCFFGSGVSCSTSSPACKVSGASCGESLCLPMADNSGPVKNFRMEALYIAAPPTLANNFLQGSVVTSAVTLNNSTQCGYGITQGLSGPGNGLFSWLLSIDTTKKTITTGGAPFSTDPYKDGYCFVDSTLKSDAGSLVLAPATQKVTLSGNTFTVGPLSGTLKIPIFLTSAPGSTPIVLPIDGVELKATMSPDGNCIGDINPAWYTTAGGGAAASGSGAACLDNSAGVPLGGSSASTCPKWFTNGSLGGYITLKDADNVCVSVLNESLCTLLTGDTAGQPCHVCGGAADKCCTPADFKKGDFCSTTKKPGGCNDSEWLSATFAGNAVKINDGGAPPCHP